MLWCLRQTIKRSLISNATHAGAHGVKIAGLNAHVMIKALRNPKVGFLEITTLMYVVSASTVLPEPPRGPGFKSAIVHVCSNTNRAFLKYVHADGILMNLMGADAFLA